jgi:hypothetical protein
MKTCKEGCGGKMKNGGKVATMKKMKVGGAKPCGPLLCPDGNGSCVNCPSAKKAGVIITSIVSGMANALGGKKRKEKEATKKAAEEAANTPVAKFTKKMDETLKTKKMGGVTKKKYAMGGSTEKALLPMMGMPMYSNNPRAEQGRILKKGGSTTNRAVRPGCTGGMVKDASGKCVMERKFKAGGSATNKKFAALAPPFNKATAADRIAGAKKNTRKK